MRNNSHKPAIRFQGFTDAWELRKLGEITVELSDYTTLNAGLPLLTSSRNGLMYQSEYRGNQTTDNKETLFSIVPLGTCTYRHMSDDDVFHLNVNTLEKGLVSREYPVFSASENNDIDFIVQHINSCAAFRSFCAEQKKGGTRTRLYYKTLCEFKMMVPSAEEQKQISIFLLSLDNLITLHQRKYEKLLTVKKSMLEKMFPRDGSNNPEIRFIGFTDPWEQRKVSDVCSISTGKSNTQDKVEDGTYPFYVRSPIIERSNRYLYDEEAVLTVGDGVGTGKVFHYVNGKYDLHQRVYRLFDFSDDVNAKFFYYWFSDHFYDRVMSMTAKTSVDSVRLEMIADMEMTAPSYDEQSKISGCLDHIDNLITLHQRKLEKLKNIKQSLLQNMFV